MRVISRKQLKELGATEYQSKLLTKALNVVRKNKLQNLYNAVEVLRQCISLSQKKTLKASTREALDNLFNELSVFIDYLKHVEPTEAEVRQIYTSIDSSVNKVNTTAPIISLDKWKLANAK